MSNETRTDKAKTTSDTSVAASLTRAHSSPWAWLPLSLLLSISILWLPTETFIFRFAPDIFVVILAGWLASRFGSKVIGFMLALSLLSVFGLEAELFDGRARVSFGIPDAAFFLALCAAVAISRPALATTTSPVSSEKWRWLKWLLPIALWIAIFVDRGPHLKIGDNISIGMNVGFVLTIILLAACADRIAMPAIYRSLFLASDSRLHQIIMSLVVVLLTLGFVLYADFEFSESVQASFGFRDSLAAMTVLAFALPAWGIVDWRIMIAILVVCFSGDWAVTWAIDTIAAAFPAEPVVPTSGVSPGNGGGLEEIVVNAAKRSPRLPQPSLVYGICATLLAVAITSFWRTRDPKFVNPRDAGIFLLLVLVVFHVGSIDSSLSLNAISLMLLGGVAYVTGLVWRVRGIIAGPLIIQFCHLLSVAVIFPKYYMFGIASDMFAIGLIAFPCAFFGYLSNRYVALPSDSDSYQTTHRVLPMTVDITALTSTVRRLDLSATLKTFVALFSILLVITNLTIIFTFFLSTLLLDWFDIDDAGIYIAIILIFFAFSIIPLAFIFWDWMVRQPWRHLAAISGAAIGAIGFAAIGIGVGVFQYSVLENFDAEDSSAGLVNVFIVGTVLIGLIAWLIGESRRVRLIVSSSGGLLLAFLLISFFYDNWLASIVDEPTTRVENTIYATSLAISAATIIWLFVRLVRNRITLSGNQPRPLLVGALYRKGFWVRLAFLAGLPSSLWHARALKTPAFWFFLFSRPLVYVGFLFVLTNAYPDLAFQTRIAVGSVIVIVGHLMFYSGKRLAARYIWDPENPIDSRDPILFLRSFEDDQLTFKRPWWDLFGHWIDLWSFRRNMDEALIDEIAQYGPVVALGMPGEEKIPFGAVRYYSSHDDWQKIISDTAKRAQTIVTCAGQTPGVLWEYGLLAREGLLDRTLLLFPPSSNDKSTGTAELTAFRDATNLSEDFQIAEDREPIALVPTADGPILLTGRETNAATYVAAIRTHFQKCHGSQLVDSLVQ